MACVSFIHARGCSKSVIPFCSAGHHRSMMIIIISSEKPILIIVKIIVILGRANFIFEGLDSTITSLSATDKAYLLCVQFHFECLSFSFPITRISTIDWRLIYLGYIGDTHIMISTCYVYTNMQCHLAPSLILMFKTKPNSVARYEYARSSNFL